MSFQVAGQPGKGLLLALNSKEQHELVCHLSQVVQSASCIAIQGGGTKPGLIAKTEGAQTLPMTELAGILEYEPSEYIITARAGTQLKDLMAELDAKQQYFPFDPMLVESGATLGGTVAANTAGPGRFRYGGVRDFIIGVEFIDGQGRIVRGGGKVVKNAAGFDFPKLLTGSAGRLGVLTELTFKVFPKPQGSITASAVTESMEDARKLIQTLRKGPHDLDAIELDASHRVILRISGHLESLEKRLARLNRLIRPFERWDEDVAADFWRQLLHPEPQEGFHRLRVPVSAETLSQLPAIPTHFSSALGMASLCLSMNEAVALPHTNLDGASRWPRSVFLDRMKQALDPEGKFGPLF